MSDNFKPESAILGRHFQFVIWKYIPYRHPLVKSKITEFQNATLMRKWKLILISNYSLLCRGPGSCNSNISCTCMYTHISDITMYVHALVSCISRAARVLHVTVHVKSPYVHVRVTATGLSTLHIHTTHPSTPFTSTSQLGPWWGPAMSPVDFRSVGRNCSMFFFCTDLFPNTLYRKCINFAPIFWGSSDLPTMHLYLYK